MGAFKNFVADDSVPVDQNVIDNTDTGEGEDEAIPNDTDTDIHIGESREDFRIIDHFREGELSLKRAVEWLSYLLGELPMTKREEKEVEKDIHRFTKDEYRISKIALMGYIRELQRSGARTTKKSRATISKGSEHVRNLVKGSLELVIGD